MADSKNIPTFLPLSKGEMEQKGWNDVDIVFITGDAYVDHPSFAMAILGRVLEKAGFRVGIVSQPDWHSPDAWRIFGKPRLFFAVSAGNMDSMINRYTANKKVRSNDAYSPGGAAHLRPDRATLVYCQRAREAYPGVPVIAGGVEASLRRLAHYDYWSDTVRRSILMDAKADLVVYGMGEKPIVEIATRLSRGDSIKNLRDMRSIAYSLGAKESIPESFAGETFITLPSYEDVKADKLQFSRATLLIHSHTNPFRAQGILQKHGDRMVVVTPPAFPLNESEMDAIYDLPFSRKPHPFYKEKIPAYDMIKDSVTIMRGCFGGCNFCSITAHQGKIVQSRSENSILTEVTKITQEDNFKGMISDVGGPTANMYQMRCSNPDIEAKCRRPSCLMPVKCPLLKTDHLPLINVLRKARAISGIKKIFVASGVRMDLAQESPEYIREIAAHHISGLLKVAPEHVDSGVLKYMRKPSIDNFSAFTEVFRQVSCSVGKPKQYLVPYFIASHPGSDLHAMIELALYLKKNKYRPEQVQDFIPAPFDISTSIYYTGLDPYTEKPVHTAKGMKERKYQRALMQYFMPENYYLVKEALMLAGRQDLIGSHDQALISAVPPERAWQTKN